MVQEEQVATSSINATPTARAGGGGGGKYAGRNQGTGGVLAGTGAVGGPGAGNGTVIQVVVVVEVVKLIQDTMVELVVQV